MIKLASAPNQYTIRFYLCFIQIAKTKYRLCSQQKTDGFNIAYITNTRMSTHVITVHS